MNRILVLTSIISCFAADINADVKISVYGGVSNFEHNVSKIGDPQSKLRDIDYQKLLKALIEFQSSIDEPWEEPLIANIDVLTLQDLMAGRVSERSGFGVVKLGARDYSSVQNKIRKQIKKWYDEAKDYFKPFGFRVFMTSPETEVKNLRKLDMSSILLEHENKPGSYIYVLRNKYDREQYYSEINFYSADDIMAAINEKAKPDLSIVTKKLDTIFKSPAPSTAKKNGLTLGVSCSYNKSIFPKVSSKYGLYLGIEGFAEINPNEAKAGGYSVKEKSFGIRPFVGLVSKDKWAIYGLFGVKCAKRSVKSNDLNINKGKMAYEIGVGSDYILSDRFSISAKFIKTLKTTVKVQNSRLSSTSTKFLLSLNYHIN